MRYKEDKDMADKEERHIKNMMETVVAVIVLIALVGFAFLPLIEEITLGAYNDASGAVRMIIGFIPVFAMLGLLGLIIKNNRMGLM